MIVSHHSALVATMMPDRHCAALDARRAPLDARRTPLAARCSSRGDRVGSGPASGWMRTESGESEHGRHHSAATS
jgi:hypothetical protein